MKNQLRIIICRFSLIPLIAFAFVVKVHSFSQPNNKNVIPSTTLIQLQEAIEITKTTASNITAAYQVCDLWRTLLDSPNVLEQLPDNIQALCFNLYASCLVRIGQDDKAIFQYERVLSKKNAPTNLAAREDAVIGKARSLQRLMKYKDAKDQFLDLKHSEIAICGAATCAMRLGDYKEAIQILSEYSDKEANNEKGKVAKEAPAMLGTLIALKELHNLHDDEAAIHMISKGSLSSALYRWILRIFAKEDLAISVLQAEYNKPISLLDLATINICAFDDPLLVRLDNKVLLHKLLTKTKAHSTTSHFWPAGIIVSGNDDDNEPVKKFLQATTNRGNNIAKSWILKRQAGYGSHGNEIIGTEEQLLSTLSKVQEECLLQQMVHPPLLIQDFKFSIRIYVVCFGLTSNSPSIYLSSIGLVKLAAVPVKSQGENDYGDESIQSVDMRIHFTNSGREVEMTQRDLDWLQEVFEAEGWSYKQFWNDISSIVQSVMKIYHADINADKHSRPASSQIRSHLAHLVLPKVLGLDFVVDATNRKPWLVEINRFPGLEARDNSDRNVKEQVLRDSWTLARHKMHQKLNKSIDFEFDFEPATEENCLVQLDIS